MGLEFAIYRSAKKTNPNKGGAPWMRAARMSFGLEKIKTAAANNIDKSAKATRVLPTGFSNPKTSPAMAPIPKKR